MGFLNDLIFASRVNYCRSVQYEEGNTRTTLRYNSYILTGATSSAPVGFVASRSEDNEIAANNASRHVVRKVERLLRRWRDEYIAASVTRRRPRRNGSKPRLELAPPDSGTWYMRRSMLVCWNDAKHEGIELILLFGDAIIAGLN